MNDWLEYKAAFEQNDLYHYASKYYDPVKAHEYYMKHRKLKHRIKSSLDRLQEITGFGLKAREKQQRQAAMNAAKSELKYRREANDPHLRKDVTVEWDSYSGHHKGSLKDRKHYEANMFKEDKNSALKLASYTRAMYDKSVLGRGEKLAKSVLSKVGSGLSNLFKNKKK